MRWLLDNGYGSMIDGIYFKDGYWYIFLVNLSNNMYYSSNKIDYHLDF